nr:hypothetical protein BaRGS_032398 [Batillaria attramentaria]
MYPGSESVASVVALDYYDRKRWDKFVMITTRKDWYLGKGRAVKSDDSARTFLRKVLALPYLPAETIQPASDKMKKTLD